jgi:hypothetical protein
MTSISRGGIYIDSTWFVYSAFSLSFSIISSSFVSIVAWYIYSCSLWLCLGQDDWSSNCYQGQYHDSSVFVLGAITYEGMACDAKLIGASLVAAVRL